MWSSNVAIESGSGGGRCGVEAAWRPSQRYTPKPSAIALSHASATPAAAPAPTASAARDPGGPCTTAIAIGTSRKQLPSITSNRRPVEAKNRRSSVAQRLVVGPVEQGKREAALPARASRRRARPARGARPGSPRRGWERRRARCSWSSRSGERPRLTQVDELCREVRRRAVRERHALDELRPRVLGERDEGEASLCVLQRVEEREPRRIDRRVPELPGRRRRRSSSKGTNIAEYRSIASPIAAARARRALSCAPLPYSTVATPSVRRPDASSHAQFGKRRLVGRVRRRDGARDDADERRDRVLEALEGLVDGREALGCECRCHAVASNHGDGTACSGDPQDGHRGTRST